MPFTLVYQDYNRIRESSLSEGLFTIHADSVGIIDVLPRGTSPYDTCYTFFAAPFKTIISQPGAISFSFPDSLWQMPGITAISVDFGDGAGFRTLAKDTTVNITYTTNGLKLITVQISTPGGTRTAKSQVEYKGAGYWPSPSAAWNFEEDKIYSSEEDYLGAARMMETDLFDCKGNIFQRLLCKARVGATVEVENGCDNVFDKPVIIVEGFDPDGSLTINELKYRFSENDFRQILKAYGYDLVYVDFTNNSALIENNAKVLEAVINKVNQEKSGNAPNHVIGFSMGGLIARWCLRDMEERSLDHEVENYFSYDAPHQGANLPLGLQYLFNEIVRDLPYLKWLNIGDFGDIANANESPAAKQMLVTKADYDNGPFNWTPSPHTLNNLRAAFAERLVVKGYPQNTNNYGISFGRGNNTATTKNAGNGVQWNNFGPGSKILEGNMTWFLVNFQSSAYAVPEGNVNDYIAKYRFQGLTFRKIFGIQILPVITLRVRNFKYTGQYPYDDAPGGYETTQARFASSLAGFANGAAGNATTYGHYGHNFVSVVSALDLQNQTYDETTEWQSDNLFFNIDNFIQNPGTVAGNTLSNPALSPFDAVITSTSNIGSAGNLFHNANISQENALFILRKILNAEPDFNCLTDGFCGSSPTISGPDNFCITSTAYSIPSLPAGAIVTWSTVLPEQ